MKRPHVLIAILLISCVNHLLAQEPAIIPGDAPGWYKIGEVKASFKIESESISVVGESRFKAIKLKVTDTPIFINKVIVVYESGETQEIPVGGMLRAGEETGEYRLKSLDDQIQKITFLYKAEPNVNENKAHVELHALK